MKKTMRPRLFLALLRIRNILVGIRILILGPLPLTIGSDPAPNPTPDPSPFFIDFKDGKE